MRILQHENYRLHLSEESSALPMCKEIILGSSRQLGHSLNNGQPRALQQASAAAFAQRLTDRVRCFVAGAFSQPWGQLLARSGWKPAAAQRPHSDPRCILCACVCALGGEHQARGISQGRAPHKTRAAEPALSCEMFSRAYFRKGLLSSPHLLKGLRFILLR